MKCLGRASLCFCFLLFFEISSPHYFQKFALDLPDIINFVHLSHFITSLFHLIDKETSHRLTNSHHLYEYIMTSEIPATNVVTGPVAAAKNRAARNLSIAKSKQDAHFLVETNDDTVVALKANSFKTKTSTTTIPPELFVNKCRIVARVSYPSSPSARPTFELPCAHKIYSKNYTFPYKLYDLLNNAKVEGYVDIISFSEDGNEFVIHNHARFASELLPQYFGHDKLRSFDRQLSYWGFKRCNRVPNSAYGGVAWIHPCMKQGERALVRSLKRTPDKSRNAPSYSNSFFAVKARRRKTKDAFGQKQTFHSASNGSTKCQVENSIAVMPSSRSPTLKTELVHKIEKPMLPQDDSPRTVSPFGGTLLGTNKEAPIITTVSRRVSNVSAESTTANEEGDDCDDSGSFDEETFNSFIPLIRLESMELGPVEELNKALRPAQAQDSSKSDSGTEDAFEGNRFHLVDEEMEDSDIASLLSLEDVPDDGNIDLDGDCHHDIIPFVTFDEAKTLVKELEYSKEVFISSLHDPLIPLGQVSSVNDVQEQQELYCPAVELDEGAADAMNVLTVEEV
jgi:hypothetical protein